MENVTEKTEKTGIIYCRVSSAEQVAGTSLEMQERLCREYAQREKIKVLECFVEEGESAKTANRTQFQKALQFCINKKKPVNYFIVHKIDRFARNQDDHTVTQMFLKKYSTKLRSVTEQIDETPTGKLMEGILATFAQFDNDVRTSRSKSGMMEKVQKGIWVWQAPLGYMRITKGGNLVIDEKQAPYIKLAFEEYAKGVHSFQSLSDFLEERGFRTKMGKNPCPQLMEKIIRNHLFCGKIKVWGREYEGSFTPIIDEELFLRCQPGLRKRTQGKRNALNPNFPLRRLLTCPACGSGLTGSTSTGRKGTLYPYYHHQKQGCPLAGFIPKETMEQSFIEYLQKLSPKLKYEKVFKAVVMDVWQANYRKLDADNTRARREIEVLEFERQRIFDLHRAGKYTDQEFLDQKDMVNIKIQQKKMLLEEKRIEEFNMEEALNYCFNFIRNSGETWKKLEDTPSFRIRFQNQAFPQKMTFDGKKFGITKMSLVLEINQQSGAQKSRIVM